MLNATQQKNISDAIAKVEADTYAELVTVLAKQADDYRYVGFTWAALMALISPTLLLTLPLWLDLQHIMIIQALTFIACALLFQWQPLRYYLVPKRLAHWHASNLACRQFLHNNLHHTEGDSGVLIFVSQAEHYVEIIADRGINQHIAPEQWQAIVNQFVVAVKAGNTEQGFLDCIQQCGALLHKHCPAQHTRNELPNHLVII